ncbi:efflux RND transporter periplasmic adaptor subunit [Desulfohalovibrio reitneri]|uniref:efflux RND transporter periplasmic adaptor subunit n=1 Tax=Desulfohalovibrio reitneri TaxID=1307759 RepID=UPI0009DFAA92|nr:efflux RND transporter periplasmic adaptor subunit [Desulfohalovibrio reitneri]
MTRKSKPFGRRTLLVVVAALALFGLGYMLGGSGDSDMPPQSREAAQDEAHDHAADTTAATEDGETVWTCSMHPQIQLPEPGQCPICFMDLIPLEEEQDGAEKVSLRQISLSPTARKLAQVQTTEVRRREVPVSTRMVGTIEYDETRQGVITAWVGGRIDKLYVDFTGSFVKKGQRMAEIYSPELYAAQAELIQAHRSLPKLEESKLDIVRETAERTRKAAREKLRLLGLTKRQIDNIIERGEPSDHVALHAPLSGVVVDKKVDEGEYVDTGTPIYTIADISRVWVMLEVYESDLPWIKMGREVKFSTEAYPGEVFSGEVVYIDPFLNPKTRTLSVRLEAENPDYMLKPGMFVRAEQRGRIEAATEKDSKNPLVIPASAPLVTGKRAVVYVAVPGEEGVYEGREIVLGPKAGDWYVVRQGLSEGEMVVSRGSFKIDSAVQIMAKPSMMTPSAGPKTDGETFQSPPEVRDELASMADEFLALSQAVSSGDLAASQTAFQAMHEAVSRVEPSQLDGDAALLWRELDMLLSNDTLIGSEAEGMGEARRIFGDVSEHWSRADTAFGVSDMVARRDAKADVPEDFKRELGAVFSAYLPMSEALARDDGATARAAAPAVSEALGQVDMGRLHPSAHDIWMAALGKIQRGLTAMDEAETMDETRSAFGTISTGLASAMKDLGVAAEGPVVEMYCSMAFEGEGGAWLQADEDVRNPYFGPAMLACGEVSGRLDQAEAAEGETGQDEPAPEAAAPKEFQKQLAGVVRAYADISDALAADAPDKARAEAERMDEALAATDMGLLASGPHDEWMGALRDMRKGLDAIGEAENLVEMRVGFEPVSEGLARAVRRLGVSGLETVHVMFCPMAFENKGAIWLQLDSELRNPYFGEVMLRCGEIRQIIRGG